MRTGHDAGADHTDDQPNKLVARAIQDAKFKNARLRQLKERNERYLAEQRGDEDTDEDQTQEL